MEKRVEWGSGLQFPWGLFEESTQCCFSVTNTLQTQLQTWLPALPTRSGSLPSHPLMCTIKARQSLQSEPRKDFQRVTVLLSLAIENRLAGETEFDLMGCYSLRKKTRKVFRSELYSLQNTVVVWMSMPPKRLLIDFHTWSSGGGAVGQVCVCVFDEGIEG